MKNRKAQALIEFVLILPILIMLLFGIIDFGNIFVTKSNLENRINDAYMVLKSSTDASTLYNDIVSAVNQGSEKDIKVELSFDSENHLVKVVLKKDIKTITPGLNLILGYPYTVKTERVMEYAEQ